MSITFNPTALLDAVEFLKSSKHIYDPVDTNPERDGQCCLVCLAVNKDGHKSPILTKLLLNTPKSQILLQAILQE